jgi:hypothetical protein
MSFRIHPRALIVALAFWVALLVARDVRWGVAAAAVAVVIDWSALILPFLRFPSSTRKSR